MIRDNPHPLLHLPTHLLNASLVRHHLPILSLFLEKFILVFTHELSLQLLVTHQCLLIFKHVLIEWALVRLLKIRRFFIRALGRARMTPEISECYAHWIITFLTSQGFSSLTSLTHLVWTLESAFFAFNAFVRSIIFLDWLESWTKVLTKDVYPRLSPLWHEYDLVKWPQVTKLDRCTDWVKTGIMIFGWLILVVSVKLILEV